MGASTTNDREDADPAILSVRFVIFFFEFLAVGGSSRKSCGDRLMIQQLNKPETAEQHDPVYRSIAI
jgi:hypothetical protein